jgi:hypothetical protein
VPEVGEELEVRYVTVDGAFGLFLFSFLLDRL